MKKKFVIFGSSGHAKVILENIMSREGYEFLGWIDPNEKAGKMIFGFPVLGSENDLISINKQQNFSGIIGIGNISLRKSVFEKITNQIPDFEFINAIHSSAIISPSAQLEKGIAIMPGAIVNAESKIGDHSIVNTGAQIDHECQIGRFVNISPSVIIGGNVRIECCAFIGMGALLINNSFVSENTQIKSGTTFNNPHI